MSLPNFTVSVRPSVRITFEGLLLFNFEKKRCVISAVPCDDHRLEITIDCQKPFRTSAKNISLFLKNSRGIKQHRSCDKPVRHSSSAGDEHDLGWLMDIQGDQFHNNPKLPKNTRLIEQKIEVNTGTFYTAVRSCDVSIFSPKSGKYQPSTIATIVGCNVTLAERELLNLTLDGKTISQFSQDALMRTVHIKYVCDYPASRDHGDFRAYYQIYDKVIEEEQFDVIATRKLQLLRGLSIQSNGPTEVCPPAESGGGS